MSNGLRITTSFCEVFAAFGQFYLSSEENRLHGTAKEGDDAPPP
jgi:hypothetical protein